MEVLEKLMSPELIWVVVPTVAIIGVFGKKMLDRYFSHKERMAKIEAGIDPDVTNA
ncbi:MAG: hypothetical protein AAGI15_02600 [Pseudomonadota bacterium]